VTQQDQQRHVRTPLHASDHGHARVVALDQGYSKVIMKNLWHSCDVLA
jgi:hypothetical protein